MKERQRRASRPLRRYSGLRELDAATEPRRRREADWWEEADEFRRGARSSASPGASPDGVETEVIVGDDKRRVGRMYD